MLPLRFPCRSSSFLFVGWNSRDEQNLGVWSEKVHSSVAISIVPPIFTATSRGPLGFGLPYDSSESARLRNIALAHACRLAFEPVVEMTNAMLRVCGVWEDSGGREKGRCRMCRLTL